ncbi:MAG: 6-bladed beta-propeller [Bacteroidota bacterium]
MKTTIFICCIILLSACSQESGESDGKAIKGIQKIDISGELYDNNYLGVIEIKNIIPLEYSTQSLVGSIDKIITYKDYIFILDSEETKSVFCFVNDGTFQFKINAIGKGPGEFTKPFDFDINIFNHQIEILDSYQRKIVVYDMVGNFLDEIKLDRQVMSFCSINQSSYLLHLDGRDFMDKGKTNLYQVWDKSKGILHSNVFDYGSTDAESIPNEYTRFDKSIHFVHAWTDTIYSCNTDGILPIYTIDFGGSRANDELKKLDLMGMMNYFKTNGLRVHSGNLCETDDLIAISWLHQDNAGDAQHYTTYYDKNTQKTFTVSQRKNWEDSVMTLGPLTTMGNDFIGILEGNVSLLREFFPEGKSLQLNYDYDIDRNPVLVQYELKDAVLD